MAQVFPISVTRTIEFSPDAYLEFCAENEDEPTQEGFYEFIEDWIDEDFRYCERHNETITILKDN